MKMNLWTDEKDPALKKELNAFESFMYHTNDGRMDVPAFCATEYGQELARRLELRAEIQFDPFGERAMAYYRSLGVTKQLFDTEDFYTQWLLYSPEEPEPGKEYPLMIWNHGGSNSIQSEETVVSFPRMLAKEGFLFMMAQNTNPDNILRLIEEVNARIPVDRSRIYIGGFSQGASQAQGAVFHYPQVFAGLVTSGNDVFRPWDNFDERYTVEEYAAFHSMHMPVMQLAGECEPFFYAPLNNWGHIIWNPKEKEQNPYDFGYCDSYFVPGREPEKDPTRIHGTHRGKAGETLPGGVRMSSMYEPKDGEDFAAWMVQTLNIRLALQDVEPRDAGRCIAYLDTPDDELHHVNGVYADREEIRTIGGLKHYISGFTCREGWESYVWITVENTEHWPQVTLGELAWEYLKQFRRDPVTKKIVCA